MVYISQPNKNQYAHMIFDYKSVSVGIMFQSVFSREEELGSTL